MPNENEKVSKFWEIPFLNVQPWGIPLVLSTRGNKFDQYWGKHFIKRMDWEKKIEQLLANAK